MALLRQESSYNPRCTSPVGAKGLGQLMPGTAAGMGVTDPYDPQQNLTASIRIIGGHLKKYGGDSWNITMEAARLALAAYNAGPGAVKKYKGIPPYRETRDYVKKVTGYYAELQRLVGQ
jgi:soluble lytic murein transglycosylase-like protein